MPHGQGTSKKNRELGKALSKRKKHDLYTSTRHATDFEASQGVSSMTVQTSLDEYLESAEVSRRNFEAERGQVRVIEQDLGVVPEDQEIDPHTLSDEEVENIEEEDFCSIPKKPLYDFDDTPETFQQKEIDSFWKWKRTLSRLQAKNPKANNFKRLIC